MNANLNRKWDDSSVIGCKWSGVASSSWPWRGCSCRKSSRFFLSFFLSFFLFLFLFLFLISPPPFSRLRMEAAPAWLKKKNELWNDRFRPAWRDFVSSHSRLDWSSDPVRNVNPHSGFVIGIRQHLCPSIHRVKSNWRSTEYHKEERKEKQESRRKEKRNDRKW